MVGYCANLPAMAYEMTTLAALKSRILSFNKSEIADRRRVSRRDVILFALVGIPSAVAAAIFLVLKATDLPLIPILTVFFLRGWLTIMTSPEERREGKDGVRSV